MDANHSLAEEFFTLDAEGRRAVHFLLCEHALKQWDLYTTAQGRIEYRETVSGTRHEVDRRLPFDAYGAALEGSDVRQVARRYLEPLAALQDDDLLFPDHIAFAYYAIYDLYKKYVLGQPLDDWMIVNQALSAESDSAEWADLLSGALEAARALRV